MQKLTHFSTEGRARMVDVSDKSISKRAAVASGMLRMRPDTLSRIQAGSIAKGDVLTVADVAAVMAAKHTADLIPMCHTLPLTGVDVSFSGDEVVDSSGCAGLSVRVTVRCVGQTGIEIEALCAVSTALLTVYDMCKAIDKGMRIENVQLEEKQGGKSGHWLRSQEVTAC